jgi:hypothetical protein
LKLPVDHSHHRREDGIPPAPHFRSTVKPPERPSRFVVKSIGGPDCTSKKAKCNHPYCAKIVAKEGRIDHPSISDVTPVDFAYETATLELFL